MNLYDVLAPGYHSPLTQTQIAELFQAGRLRRDHPCKPVKHKEWRTVDELFPLLKYQSAGFAFEYSPAAPLAFIPKTRALLLGLLAAVCLIGALAYYFSSRATLPTQSAHVTAHHWPRNISSAATPLPVISQPDPAENSPEVLAPRANVPETAVHLRQQQVAVPQQQAAERQREQSERNRLRAALAAAEQKARGKDTITPLDEYTVVNVGGANVTVKIRDNDVTSFDIWINGAHRREVPKQKGITQSGTDETLIYDSGRAKLYYVWEISGTLNHCRLRVRED